MTESPATTLVTYVGIVGRKRPVDGRVVHPPRAGDHIRLMTWSSSKLDFRLTYYEVTHVMWDVRVGYGHRYVPGAEGEGYLTAFVKPVKGGPGEVFDRAERAADRARNRRKGQRRPRGAEKAPPPAS